jgi:hypothetical protein
MTRSDLIDLAVREAMRTLRKRHWMHFEPDACGQCFAELCWHIRAVAWPRHILSHPTEET